MATKTKWAHVYDDDNEGKYLGFFVDPKEAERWMAKQKKGRNLRLSDKRPVRRDA